MVFGFLKKQQPQNNQDINNRTSCKSCKTNCIDEVLEKTGQKNNFKLSYEQLPLHIQLQMEKLRELIVKITEDIKINNYSSAMKKKQDAIETYAQMLGSITNTYGPNHPLALNFYYIVELILQRHTTEESYRFLNQ
ncbi:MAG: hypothetical protein QXV64_02630 [Candidatus Anstonellaceae archaeon]